MKKRLSLATLIIICVTFCLVSCDKTNEQTQIIPKLEIAQKEYSIGSDGGSFDIIVSTNISPTVTVSNEWIKINSLGGSAQKTGYTVNVESNNRFDNCEARTGTITFAYAEEGLSQTVTVRQEKGSLLIAFKDKTTKAICVKNWDVNHDGELSEQEAANVSSLNVNLNGINSFDELKFFTGITTIPDRCFYNCTNLLSVTLPAGLKSIGRSAFEKCGIQGELIFPEGLEVIEYNAFSDCPGLTGTIVFPMNLRELGNNAFFNCTGISGACFTSDNLMILSDNCFCSCKNLQFLTLPTGLKSIGFNAFRGCGIKGELILPDGLESIKGYAFCDCTELTGKLVFPNSLKELGEKAFYRCSGISGDLAIPEGIRIVPKLCFYECSGLNGTLSLPESTDTISTYAFYYNHFSKITLSAETPPACEGDCFLFDSNDECLIYVPKGKASVYHETEGWKDYRGRITEEGYHPWDFFYASTDFSKDGEVVCLQKATKGAGINLVFLGDGYLDRDMGSGGKYETAMRRWMEQFFVYEPYRSLRDWFSVYTVKVISKNEVIGNTHSERKLTKDVCEDQKDDIGNAISVLSSVCEEYAALVPNPYGQGQRIAVFMNTGQPIGRSFCYIGGISCLAVIFDSIDHSPTVLNHELGGHGLALLEDEYSEFNQSYPDAQQNLEDGWSWGFGLNLDWRSSPESVLWARFLKDPRYSGEGLGVFEGGGRYVYGVFRPSENSLMRYNSMKGAVFNAPSREAIYKRIMRIGIGESWEYDYETFVEADKSGRQQAAEAYASTRSSVAMDDFEPGLPPVFSEKDVKEIRVSKDGKVTLIR